MAIVSIEYINETKQLVKDIATAFLHLGKRLYTMQEQRLWEGHYNNYEEFLTDIDLSPGHASKLRQIYERFILEQGFKPEELAEYSQRTLYAILPTCTDKNASERNFSRFRGVSVKDVERIMKTEKVGEHKHDWILLKVCTVCKERRREYNGVEQTYDTD